MDQRTRSLSLFLFISLISMGWKRRCYGRSDNQWIAVRQPTRAEYNDGSWRITKLSRQRNNGRRIIPVSNHSNVSTMFNTWSTTGLNWQQQWTLDNDTDFFRPWTTTNRLPTRVLLKCIATSLDQHAGSMITPNSNNIPISPRNLGKSRVESQRRAPSPWSQ